MLVANLMTEPGETDDYSVLEHVLTIERHLGAQLFDYVIYNTSAGAGAPGGGVCGQAFAADRDRHVRVERAREAGHPSRSACRWFRNTPRARSAITPNGLARRSPRSVSGKLGAWRSRAEAGGL